MAGSRPATSRATDFPLRFHQISSFLLRFFFRLTPVSSRVDCAAKLEDINVKYFFKQKNYFFQLFYVWIPMLPQCTAGNPTNQKFELSFGKITCLDQDKCQKVHHGAPHWAVGLIYAAFLITFRKCVFLHENQVFSQFLKIAAQIFLRGLAFTIGFNLSTRYPTARLYRPRGCPGCGERSLAIRSKQTTPI